MQKMKEVIAILMIFVISVQVSYANRVIVDTQPDYGEAIAGELLWVWP